MSAEMSNGFNYQVKVESKFEDQEYHENQKFNNRFKVRKYANRQAFLERRKAWNSEDVGEMQENQTPSERFRQMGAEDKVFDNSLESISTDNSSLFQDCIIQCETKPYVNSCPIWTEKQVFIRKERNYFLILCVITFITISKSYTMELKTYWEIKALKLHVASR